MAYGFSHIGAVAALTASFAFCAACGGSSDGSGASRSPVVAGCPVFPGDNPWNRTITDLPVHPNSDRYIDAMGRSGRLHPEFSSTSADPVLGIPYLVVGASEPRLPVTFRSERQSDPGPYPIPLNAPIEGGADSSGDRHVLAVDRDACTLYELYAAYPDNGGWRAGAGAIWDLRANIARPVGFTSADASGLAIFPGLVRYEEAIQEQEIAHALRFTVASTQAGFVAPATHYASDSANMSYPPMGARFRMKASYDCSGYTAPVQVVCTALKRYGMLIADNGLNWHLVGAPDPRWNDGELADLLHITGDAFEVVDTGPIQSY